MMVDNYLNMEYNSQRELLIIPEYGRNIQRLILHGKSIEDEQEKQEFIEKVVMLMQQMHPQNRNIEDYRERLWKHVFRIADYELTVTPPSGIIPTPEDYKKKPEKIPYPATDARFRHYGNNVQQLIKKALEMEEGPKLEGFIKVIGSYMKLAYKTWNKEHYVSDEIIRNDLLTLSDNKLILPEDTSIDDLANAKKRKKNDGRDRDSRDNRRGRNNHRNGRNNGNRGRR